MTEKIITLAEFSQTCQEIKAQFDYLVFITAIDYPDRGILRLVYYFQSLAPKADLALKVELKRDNPEIPSLAADWPASNWHEREIYDLFGVKFIGHPDLRRILLPPDWVGHPLRKDYVKTGVLKRPETIK